MGGGRGLGEEEERETAFKMQNMREYQKRSINFQVENIFRGAE